MHKTLSLLLLCPLILWSANALAAPLPVTASFSILADIVKQVGGDDVTVTTLVGPDSDAHSFEPTPAHVRQLTESKILFVNGLGFEGWMDRLAQSAQYKGEVVVASTGIKPLTFQEDAEHGTVTDPHAWQDLSNGKIYIRNIAAALKRALPDRGSALEQRAEATITLYEKKHQEILASVAAIPPNHRKIITSHDAFGYFGRAYGIVFLAPVGLSTEEEASASSLARLAKQIQDNGIHTIFLENMASPRLVQQLAHEAHAKVGDTLYSDALSAEGGAAPTYLRMFDNNVPKLLAAMKESTGK